MSLILGTLAIVFILAAVLPILKHEAWWIRIFDLPRAQIAVVGVPITAAYLWLLEPSSPGEWALPVILVFCAIYQGWKILPYTALFPSQATAAKTEGHSCGRLSVLIANVMMEIGRQTASSSSFVRPIRTWF